MPVTSKIKRLCVIRWNYLFHHTREMPLPKHALPAGAELLLPCDKHSLVPSAASRLQRGDQLGVITIDGELAHRSLVQTIGVAGMEGDPSALRLQPGQIYIHYCETLPAFRGRGLYPAMLTAILEYWRRQPDFREALIACRQNNIASVRSILKAGFRYRSSSLAVGLLGERLSHSWFYQSQRLPALT